MKTEALQMATIHPDTLADERLILHTDDGLRVYCPRNKTKAAIDHYNTAVQHPVDLIEFIACGCRGYGITNTELTGIYLAAKSVLAEMDGDQSEARRLSETYDRLMTAKKAAGDIISKSGIEQAINEYRNSDIPF